MTSLPKDNLWLNNLWLNKLWLIDYVSLKSCCLLSFRVRWTMLVWKIIVRGHCFYRTNISVRVRVRQTLFNLFKNIFNASPPPSSKSCSWTWNPARATFLELGRSDSYWTSHRSFCPLDPNSDIWPFDLYLHVKYFTQIGSSSVVDLCLTVK